MGVWRDGAGGGLCEGVLLYLLGGDEKQLQSPLLFQASPLLSYPLIFQNTAFSPSYEALQQLCLRPRSWQTANRPVIGRLPALVVKPLHLHCRFPIPQPLWCGLKPSIHPSFSPPGFPSASDSSVSTRATRHTASQSAVTVLLNHSYDPRTICLQAHGFSTCDYSLEFTRCLSCHSFPPDQLFITPSYE